MKEITESDVTFSLKVEEQENVWAMVWVTASLALPDGSTAVGASFSDSYSFKNEEDFKHSDFYEDMKKDAMQNLRERISKEIERGVMLAVYFEAI